MGDKMKVSLLGSFEIEYNGEKLLYHDYRSKQITKLLTYLILNRKKQIFNTTTADIMFNDHDSNDPINALKALVYRVRCVLKKSFGDEQFILNAKGSYYWNPNIDVLVDAEEFIDTLKCAKFADKQDVHTFYEKASALYKGRMLPMLAGDDWIDSENQYLETQALSVMLSLIKYYYENKIDNKFEEIYKNFLKIDPYNESVYYYGISHYMDEGHEDIARKYYAQIEKLFAKNLGIKPSEKLTKLLDAKKRTQGFAYIKEILAEDNEETAFECSNDEFTRLCQLEARRLKRSNEDVYVIDVQLTPHNKGLDEDLVDRILESTMSLLRNALLAGLRSEDCISVAGKDHYLILIEASEMYIPKIMERITKKLYELDKYHRADISYVYEDIKKMSK